MAPDLLSLLLLFMLSSATTATGISNMKKDEKPKPITWKDYISVSTEPCDDEDCLSVKFGKDPDYYEAIDFKKDRDFPKGGYKRPSASFTFYGPTIKEGKHQWPYIFWHYSFVKLNPKALLGREYEFKRGANPYQTIKYSAKGLIDLIHNREIEINEWGYRFAPPIPCGLEDPPSIFSVLKLRKPTQCQAKSIACGCDNVLGGFGCITGKEWGAGGHVTYTGIKLKDDVARNTMRFREGCVLYLRTNSIWTQYRLVDVSPKEVKFKKFIPIQKGRKPRKKHSKTGLYTTTMWYDEGEETPFTMSEFVEKCKSGEVALDEDKEKRPCFEGKSDAMSYGMDDVYDEDGYDDDAHFYDVLYEYLVDLMERIKM